MRVVRRGVVPDKESRDPSCNVFQGLKTASVQKAASLQLIRWT